MKRLLPALLLVCLAAPPATADSPGISRVTPRGGQRGTEIELTLSGANLKDAQQILLYKPGLEVLSLVADGEATLKAKLRIAADAPLGEHPLRVRTATGVSDLRTFVVGPFASFDEKEPNNKFSEPQKIPLNVTVTGVVGNEDVDTFAVDLKKGQRLTAELEGMRLGTALFDATISVLDTKRFELASSDDSALLLQDPLLSMVAPEDGTFILQVRETSYGGSDQSHYRLHVGTFPRPTAVYPPGGKAGDTLDVTFLGDARGPLKRSVTLPVDPVERHGVFADEDGQSPPSPNWMRVSPFPNVLEVEPNDAREQATAAGLPLPLALNGIIEKNGDEDWFRFTAKKGDTYDVKVYARAVRSPLDPVLEIWAAGGKRIAANDDQGGPDSVARFSAPADGEYEIRVRDHLRKGGPTFVYRVEFNASQASVHTHIPAYDREPRDQVRQWVVVPKGNRFATWIRVNRQNASGAMNLEFEGLPPGITVLVDAVPADLDRVPVVFEAKADAVVAGTLADVVARAADPAQKLLGGFRQDVNLIYGPPNNTIYYGTRVDKLAVAVAEEAPYSIRIVEPKAPIVQNGAVNLKVVADRKPGFDKPIELRLLWTPPGMGAQGTVAIPQGQSEALYPLNANGNAALKTWKMVILGSADTGRGLCWVSTQPAPLTVVSPYLSAKIEMSTVEQGRETDVVVKLEHLRPFEGTAKIALGGLPPLTVAEPAEREFAKGDAQVSFHVKIDPKSPAGQHKSLFASVTVIESGEAVLGTAGAGGVMRIDVPSAPKKDAPLLKAGDKKPDAPKNLSRLEQLRREAEEKK